MAFDKLIEKIIETQNPTVAGLDPKLDYVPAYIRKGFFEEDGEIISRQTIEAAIDGGHAEAYRIQYNGKNAGGVPASGRRAASCL